jgi:hypothetical protein
VLVQVHLLEPDRAQAGRAQAGEHQVHARARAEEDAAAPAQPAHELDVGPDAEARRGAVGRRHQHARKLAQQPLEPRLLAPVVEVEDRHAGREGAEERLVAIAVAADDLDLPAARLHVLGEVEGGADRPAHVPGRPEDDDQPAVAAGLARGAAHDAEQHAADDARDQSLDLEDHRPGSIRGGR